MCTRPPTLLSSLKQRPVVLLVERATRSHVRTHSQHKSGICAQEHEAMGRSKMLFDCKSVCGRRGQKQREASGFAPTAGPHKSKQPRILSGSVLGSRFRNFAPFEGAWLTPLSRQEPKLYSVTAVSSGDESQIPRPTSYDYMDLVLYSINLTARSVSIN